MKRDPVQSSNIETIGYDPENEILEIEFKGGATYTYDKVPADEHRALMNSESIGSYFHQNIRNKFKFTRQ